MKEGIFQFRECKVIVAIEPIKRGGAMGWHLSISHHRRLPTYEELKDARYIFVPNNVYMAQIFPPSEQFVNIHPFCLHLYEI